MFYSLGGNAPLITAAAITVRLMAASWGSQTQSDPTSESLHRDQPGIRLGQDLGIWSLIYKVFSVFSRK